jgi:hydroxyacylglutathione hydrolase
MSKHGDLMVTTIVNGPFVENCFVASAPSKEAFLIDPGDEPDRIQQQIEELGLKVTAIVNTHGHIDHIGAVAALKASLGVPFYLHVGDHRWVENLPAQAAMFGLPPRDVPEVDHELIDGQVMQLGELSCRILHTPGHSAGGCCLYFERERVVFVGDTLFQGSVGRTDLPGGNHPTLISSIREKLLGLGDEVVAYSGHGPPTTIGEEREMNPFLR